jgi:carboxylesterase
MAYPVLSGAEAFAFPGGDIGVLLLHGFTGSPQGLRPWGEALRDGGHTVVCPLLPGHGTHWQDLAGARGADWVAASEAALDDLAGRCRSVVVCSVSFGRRLGLASGRHPARAGRRRGHHQRLPVPQGPPTAVAAAAEVPGCDGTGRGAATWPTRPRRSWPTNGSRSRRWRRCWGSSARSGPSCPGCVSRCSATSPAQVHVVDPGCTTYLAGHVAATDVQVVWLERSYHVATLDYDRQVIFDGSLAFIRRVAGAG